MTTYSPYSRPPKTHNKVIVMSIVLGTLALFIVLLVIALNGSDPGSGTPTAPSGPSVDQSSYDMGYQNGASGYAARLMLDGGAANPGQACDLTEKALYMYDDNPALRGTYAGPIPNNIDDWMKGCLAGASTH
jgi:hypothetical protein